MIYLRMTDYGIAIIRVLHFRMDAPRHLRCKATTYPPEKSFGAHSATRDRLATVPPEFNDPDPF